MRIALVLKDVDTEQSAIDLLDRDALLVKRYLPLGEPRTIAEHSIIHQSAIRREKIVQTYRPVNMPEEFESETLSDLSD